MRPNAEPLTAVERARLAYEQMKRREHHAAMTRRARARTRNIALALTMAVMLSLGLGLSIYKDWMPASLRSSAHDMRADSGGRFGQDRTAQVRSHIKGNTCQELKFSNDSGALLGGSFVPCEPESKREAVFPLLPGPNPKGPRLNSIRDAFSR